MVASEDCLHSIVERIYASVEQPELWPETICAIGEQIGGPREFWVVEQGVGARPQVREASCHGTLLLSQADLRALDEYAEEFGELIYRFLEIVLLSMLRSRKDIGTRDAIVLRMARRYLQAFETKSLKSNVGARNLIAALWEEGRIFNRDHLRNMRLLATHLDRALRLQMRMSLTELRADVLSGALERLTLGVVFLDGSGRPVWTNRRAEDIIACSKGLKMSVTGLLGERRANTKSLRELIDGAINGQRGLLGLPREDNSRPLLVTAVPFMLRESSIEGEHFARAVLFICDPDQPDDPGVDALRRAFNLTYREAEVTIAIARGHGLKAAADSMGVALTTARSQLQQAFAKTGTKQQAELASLINRTLTHLRTD
jgi:DNA-binding CsgD family transcriptional regulator/PAS domain-containing protein